MQAFLGILALLLNAIGYAPYIRGILRGQVKPHRFTWGIWTILTTIAAVNQVQNGGGFSTPFFISTTLLVLIVFALSFRFGFGGASLLDRVCLVLAILLLIYWAFVHDTHASTYLAVTIDGIGALPTLQKTYDHPETEAYTQWVLAGLAGLLSLLAVPHFQLVLVVYPLYVFAMNAAIVLAKRFSPRATRPA